MFKDKKIKNKRNKKIKINNYTKSKIKKKKN